MLLSRPFKWWANPLQTCVLQDERREREEGGILPEIRNKRLRDTSQGRSTDEALTKRGERGSENLWRHRGKLSISFLCFVVLETWRGERVGRRGRPGKDAEDPTRSKPKTQYLLSDPEKYATGAPCFRSARPSLFLSRMKTEQTRQTC